MISSKIIGFTGIELVLFLITNM